MYKPQKKRNSDDLAHLIEPHITSGTTVVMDVASPFRNQALSNKLAGVPNAAGFKQ